MDWLDDVEGIEVIGDPAEEVSLDVGAETGTFLPETKRVKGVDRTQGVLRPTRLEELIGEDHLMRAIWELTKEFDLSCFYEGIRVEHGEAGRTAENPRVLVSAWVYAYCRGEGSAREIARRMEEDAAYVWLTGMRKINHHTLSDFRREHEEGLKKVFTDLLGVLAKGGYVKLEEVMHDGTKVRANAGSGSFHRERTLEEHREEARQLVEKLQGETEEEGNRRRRARRESSARERAERLQAAREALEAIREKKNNAEEREEARASETDPDCRVMRESNGGFGASYNVQLSVDAEAKVIVGCGVSQSSSDGELLEAAMDRVEEQAGKRPEGMTADAGFTTLGAMLAAAERGIRLTGSENNHAETERKKALKKGVTEEYLNVKFEHDEERDVMVCPKGCDLRLAKQEKAVGGIRKYYRGEESACGGCGEKSKCCPRVAVRQVIRVEEGEVVKRFRDWMKTEEAKAIYRRRSEVSEFPNAWLKEKMKFRRFHLRGLRKVSMETMWVCLAYNVLQWFRLCWKPRVMALMAAG